MKTSDELDCEYPWERSLDDLDYTITERNAGSDADLRVLERTERNGKQQRTSETFGKDNLKVILPREKPISCSV